MLYTEQILRDVFKADDSYIARFKSIAESANITLDELFLGQVDAADKYSSDDRIEIVATLKELVEQQFSLVIPSDERTYTASAGAPGAGKTFALEKMFGISVSDRKFIENAIYVGPDSVVLPQMRAHLEDCANPGIGNAKAYAKWRDASNYIANFMLIKAITENLNIVHDTTSTSTRTKTILDTLGNRGYTRHMHFYIADKDSRERAIMHRKEKVGFTMVTLSDVSSKAVAAYQRLADHSYEGCVEQIILYAQEGKYWLGCGGTMAFATYNPSVDTNIQIFSDGGRHVDHILQQAKDNENLEPDLQKAFNDAVNGWVVAPIAKEKLSLGYSMS